MTEKDMLNFRVRNTQRLFHDRFTTKVKIDNYLKDYYPDEEWNLTEPYSAYVARMESASERYYASVERYLNPMIALINDQGLDQFCYMQMGRASFSFYFETVAQADVFVKEFAIEVVEVTKPSDSFDAEKLNTKQNINRLFRDTNFHGSFEWKVAFDDDVEGDDLNSWVEDFFLGDSERFYFNQNNSKKVLYLGCEEDVVVTKMSFGHNINSIEQIVC